MDEECQVQSSPPPQSSRTATTRPQSSRERLSQYSTKLTGISEIDREQTIPALALRAYHLPGNDYCQDYRQYFSNNHPVLGICLHHNLHPVRFWMRIVILLGSIVFGLAITNVIWLWFFYVEQDTVLFVLSASDGGVDSQQQVVVTKGMVILWTVGGVLHALFDNTIWFITACVCCLPGQRFGHLERYRRYGTYAVVMAVVVCAAIATLVIVIRAASGDGGSPVEDIDLQQVHDPSAFSFLASYGIELALSLFVYYFVFATILFTGILGCGRIPILGGRPYEMTREQKRKERGARSRSSLAIADQV